MDGTPSSGGLEGSGSGWAVTAGAVFAATTTQLAAATFLVPHWSQFEEKGFGARLVAYPVLMMLVPAGWALWRRATGGTMALPWAGIALIMAPFLIDVTGNWTPPAPLVPGLELALGVVIVIALSILGSVVLSSTANGIAVFMLFGAGLTAGLLGTIGHALSSPTIEHASKIAAWALPFEALYQDGLRMITGDESGLTGFLLQLGPFGGAYVHGWPIRIWAVLYLLAVGATALALFARKDL